MLSLLKRAAARWLPARIYENLRRLWRYGRSVRNSRRRRAEEKRKRTYRRLEIGPGEKRIDGFETLCILPGPHVDHVADATKTLPFADESFDLIYASHVLEHVSWYQLDAVLAEWVRILKTDGWFEVWVPDGVKICKAFVDAEMNGDCYIEKDGWYRFNREKDPCKWASGRIFSYGDGTGRPDSPNWHRAVFSLRYLKQLLETAGLDDVQEMDHSQVRGHDHGWINLGMKGRKKESNIKGKKR